MKKLIFVLTAAVWGVLAPMPPLPSATPAAEAESTEPASACFEITVGWRICAAPAVPVVGPLFVLSERVKPGQFSDGHRGTEIRRLYLYDAGTDKYWSAFDYGAIHYSNADPQETSTSLSAVQLAGTHLIVWRGGQVQRVALNGHMEAVLSDGRWLRAVKVSPDGTNVAILDQVDDTLVVLDIATGEERLRVTGDAPALAPLYERAHPKMGEWRGDGTALSITFTDYDTYDDPPITAILGLDGSIRVLPEDWLPSPDLRYAIRVGELLDYSAFSRHAPLWDRIEVLDVETSRVLWTIADEAGIQPPSLGWFWVGGPTSVVFRTGSSEERALDTATGEIRSLAEEIRRRLLGPVRSNCGVPERVWDRRYDPTFRAPCDVRYDGRLVWEGAKHWTWYLGRIDLPDGFALPGITLLDGARPTVSVPRPPPRYAMVGPLLVYEVGAARSLNQDQYDETIRNDPIAWLIPRWFQLPQTRRVIVHDEGTGASWFLFEYSDVIGSRWRTPPGQTASGGLVAAFNGGLFYVLPDGHLTKLHDSQPASWDFQVSPDGRKVVAHIDKHFVVFDLPSGDAILQVAEDDVIAAAGEVPREGYVYVWLNYGRDSRLHTWSPDSATILITQGERWGDGVVGVRAGTVTLDGTIEFLDSREHPDPVEPESEPRASTDCPDNPAHSCRILLDGEVVGEGRWPTIIGVVELD